MTEKKPAADVKSGWKTSELWLAVVAILGLLVGFDKLTPAQQALILAKAEIIVPAALVIGAAAWAFYTKIRANLKKG